MAGGVLSALSLVLPVILLSECFLRSELLSSALTPWIHLKTYLQKKIHIAGASIACSLLSWT